MGSGHLPCPRMGLRNWRLRIRTETTPRKDAGRRPRNRRHEGHSAMQLEPRPWRRDSYVRAMEKRLTTLEATVRALSTTIESRSSPEKPTVNVNPSETEAKTEYDEVDFHTGTSLCPGPIVRLRFQRALGKGSVFDSSGNCRSREWAKLGGGLA